MKKIIMTSSEGKLNSFKVYVENGDVIIIDCINKEIFNFHKYLNIYKEIFNEFTSEVAMKIARYLTSINNEFEKEYYKFLKTDRKYLATVQREVELCLLNMNSKKHINREV